MTLKRAASSRRYGDPFMNLRRVLNDFFKTTRGRPTRKGAPKEVTFIDEQGNGPVNILRVIYLGVHD